MRRAGIKIMKTKENGLSNPEQLTLATPREVFTELCELLEEYSPSWYTEEERSRALTALRMLGGSRPSLRKQISAC